MMIPYIAIMVINVLEVERGAGRDIAEQGERVDILKKRDHQSLLRPLKIFPLY